MVRMQKSVLLSVSSTVLSVSGCGCSPPTNGTMCCTEHTVMADENESVRPERVTIEEGEDICLGR